MADASQYFAVRDLEVAQTPVAVVAPFACNYWVVRAVSGDINIFTDLGNQAGTEDTLAQGGQEGMLDKQSPLSGMRYPKDTIFCYLIAASGTIKCKATFGV